jgi:hypothetical protein
MLGNLPQRGWNYNYGVVAVLAGKALQSKYLWRRHSWYTESEPEPFTVPVPGSACRGGDENLPK